MPMWSELLLLCIFQKYIEKRALREEKCLGSAFDSENHLQRYKKVRISICAPPTLQCSFSLLPSHPQFCSHSILSSYSNPGAAKRRKSSRGRRQSEMGTASNLLPEATASADLMVQPSLLPYILRLVWHTYLLTFHAQGPGSYAAQGGFHGFCKDE